MDSDALVTALLILVPILAFVSLWAYVGSQRARAADAGGPVRSTRASALAAAWPGVMVVALIAAVALLILDAGSAIRFDAPFVLFFGLWAVAIGWSTRSEAGSDPAADSSPRDQSDAHRRRTALLPLVAIFAVSIVVRALISH